MKRKSNQNQISFKDQINFKLIYQDSLNYKILGSQHHSKYLFFFSELSRFYAKECLNLALKKRIVFVNKIYILHLTSSQYIHV